MADENPLFQVLKDGEVVHETESMDEAEALARNVMDDDTSAKAGASRIVMIRKVTLEKVWMAYSGKFMELDPLGRRQGTVG